MYVCIRAFLKPFLQAKYPLQRVFYEPLISAISKAVHSITVPKTSEKWYLSIARKINLKGQLEQKDRFKGINQLQHYMWSSRIMYCRKGPEDQQHGQQH